MTSINEILNDIIINQPPHLHPYTVQDLQIEFCNEIRQYQQNEITEIELYEVICEAIDRHNF